MTILPPYKQLELNNLVAQILKQQEEIMAKITWQSEDIVTEPLLNPLLDDIGLPPGPAREATKKHLTALVKEQEANGDRIFEMGDCNCMAMAFYEGFYAGKNLEPIFC